jgi:hypothetical protein
MLGTEGVEYNAEVKVSYKTKYLKEVFLEVLSDEIGHMCGAFGKVCTHIYIYTTNSSFTIQEDAYQLWVYLSMRYHLKEGGSNGVGILTALYSVKRGWTFREIGQ